MTQHHPHAPLAVLTLASVLVLCSPASAVPGRGALPGRLSPQDYWRLSTELSEPNGYFRSDNLLSNEMVFARVLPPLLERVPPGGVYLGVGPEQNFTYMAALRPRLAFILDIRRGNLHTLLMYKALFALSADRAEFVSRLFTKARPDGLDGASTVQQIMDAYWRQPSGGDEAFQRNLQAVYDVLQRKDGLPLDPEDLDGIKYVYHSFYWFGPGITWSSSSSGASGGRATYHDLMVQADGAGRYLSYLASEQAFRYLKDMHHRNLVVPVVGNFAGPSALRAIGDYVRRHDAVVSAFYLSNVEQYLRQDGVWQTFCGNVAALPLDDASVFIRPSGSGVRNIVTFVVRDNGGRPPLMTPAPSPFAAAPVAPILPEARGCGSPVAR